jgi:hypothetical protein
MKLNGCTLPPQAHFIIRYHSFYGELHTHLAPLGELDSVRPGVSQPQAPSLSLPSSSFAAFLFTPSIERPVIRQPGDCLVLLKRPTFISSNDDGRTLEQLTSCEVSNLLQELSCMCRDSFAPPAALHRENAYQHLLNDHDREMLLWLKRFK